MQINNLNLGAGRKLFPHARPSQALREEDAFMQLHGGTGSRLIFEIVSGLASGGYCIRHLLGKIPAEKSQRTTRNFTSLGRVP